MVPMLKFLQSTGSYLMLNVYPYYDYMQTNGVVPLDYALFRPLPPNKEAIDSNTLLHYTNVFDAIVDAAYFAMSYLKFTNIPILGRLAKLLLTLTYSPFVDLHTLYIF